MTKSEAKRRGELALKAGRTIRFWTKDGRGVYLTPHYGEWLEGDEALTRTYQPDPTWMIDKRFDPSDEVFVLEK